MVFAVNCGADGSPNSFTNFKNAALNIGKQLAAEAASSTTVETSSTAVAMSSAVAAPPAATSGTTTSSAPATTHTILVGGGSQIAYSPSEIQAAQNDVVVFQL